MNKVKLLLDTSRPISWVNTAYPFSLSYILLGGQLNAQFFISTVFFLIPYNLLMYGVNDIFDYESDINNPRKGGIEGAVTPKKYHKFILKACALLCIPPILLMSLLGNLQSALVLAAVLFFVVAYSIKSLRFKEKPILDSITSSIHFVGPLLYSVSLVGSNSKVWIIAFAFFLWGMASHAFGAVQDILPDRQAKISSVATVFGAQKTVRISAVLYFVSTVLVMAQGGVLIFIGISLTSYLFNILPYWNIQDSNSESSNKAWKRFIKINYAVGAIITIAAILAKI